MTLGRARGITLVEIVIAVLIVAVAFIPIIYTIQYGNKATVKINNYGEVAKLAQGLIEECKHVPFPRVRDDYKGLAKDKWEIVNQNYYPKTYAAIEKFKDTLKSLELNAQLKVVKREEIVREVWIQIHATWKEGDGTTDNAPRELRLSNAIRNPEAD
ncbi:MAG: hypothetical protein GX442_19255 [Candidatus Riflebacteria bacterium]|nr:hypothetical protein [Candidatus Riflebacteria bacterium]